MEGTASTGTRATLRQRADGRSGLRAEIERAYAAGLGRSPRYDELDGLERFWEWFSRAHRHDGDQVQRSWPQVARGLGYPDLGTVRANKDRWESLCKRKARRFVELGWLESCDAVWRGRESTGVLFVISAAGRHHARMRAPVAQLDRAAEVRRRSHPPPGRPAAAAASQPGSGRASSGGRVPPPSRGRQGRESSSVKSKFSVGTAGVGACVRREPAASDAIAASRGLKRGAALDALRISTEAAGRAAIEGTPQGGRPPWTFRSPAIRAALREVAAAGEDPIVVAIVAWEHFVARDRHPALTRLRREHLLRYAPIVDRYSGGGPGAWADTLCQLMQLADREHVVSLDYFVCQLRWSARRWRRMAKGKTAHTEKRVAGRLVTNEWWLERFERLGPVEAAAREQRFRERRRRGC